MGLVAAATLALRLERIAQSDLLRLEKLCTFWELPVRVPGAFQPEAILSAIKMDKKKVGNTLHFILPVKPGKVIDIDDLDLEELKQVLATLREK